ncbi:MAG: geranylgeranylglycerol-phosphate geranylgeranyltransferase [Candidatus Heimdallarchaeota archaeon]
MKLKDIIEILRPINDIMGSFTVVIGILNTRIDIPVDLIIINIILGAITYFFIAASGMVINDIYDIEIDKINRPQRPIPSGRISIHQAKIIFFITYGVGIVISIFHSLFFRLGFLNIILAVFFGFIGWVYAKWGKKSGFFGNLIVSVSFSIGLIYGAILNNALIPSYIYFFFLTSFFLLLSREVIKGCEDIEGDRELNVKTLAILIGIKKSTKMAITFSFLAIIFFILPNLTPIISPTLFLISMIFGLAVVGYATILMFYSKSERENFKKISLFLKVGAFLGLLAFLLASI